MAVSAALDQGRPCGLDSEHGESVTCESHVLPTSGGEGEDVPRLDDLLSSHEVACGGVRVDEPLGEGLGVFVLPGVVHLLHGIQRVVALLRSRGGCESTESLRGVDELGRSVRGDISVGPADQQQNGKSYDDPTGSSYFVIHRCVRLPFQTTNNDTLSFIFSCICPL